MGSLAAVLGARMVAISLPSYFNSEIVELIESAESNFDVGCLKLCYGESSSELTIRVCGEDVVGLLLILLRDPLAAFEKFRWFSGLH